MVANNIEPSSPIHPGEMLQDEIDARGLSQKQLADLTGISKTVISEIVHGRRGVNTEYALLLEAALGINAEIWLRIQADYDMQVIKSDKSFMSRLLQIRSFAAVL